MKNMNLWLRPAVLIAAWVLVAALTLFQLATLATALQAQSGRAAHVRKPVQGMIREARAQPVRPRSVAR